MDLLERFARGDIDAFEELFRQFQHEVYTWIDRIVRDHATAEDLTIETFWRAYRGRARLRADGNLAGWLRAIATNLSRDHLKSRRRDSSIGLEASIDPREFPLSNPEMREQIVRAFDHLSPTLRVVATLALVEEVPHREIAAALGISEGAVRVRLFRATRILRSQLEDLVPSHERSR